MALTTKEAVKKDLVIDKANLNAEIEQKIIAATGEILVFCRQPLVKTVVAVEVDPRDIDGMDIRLRYFPVISIDSLTYRGEVGSSVATVGPGTYELRRRNSGYVLRSNAGLVSSYDYTLMLTVGYDPEGFDPALTAETDPAFQSTRYHLGNIEQICIELVGDMLRKTVLPGVGKNTLGKKSIAESGETGSKTTTFLDVRPDLQARLAPYRRPML